MSEKAKPQRFFDYAAQFGLAEVENTKKTAEERQAEVQRNLTLAEQIKRADQGANYGRGNKGV